MWVQQRENKQTNNYIFTNQCTKEITKDRQFRTAKQQNLNICWLGERTSIAHNVLANNGNNEKQLKWVLTFDVVKRNSKEEEVGEEEAGELVGRARRKLSKNGVKSGQTDQKEF